MRLVLDTKVLLVSISSNSKYHWLLQKLLNGDIVICVTNEILAEYEEIVSQHMGRIASDSLLGLLENLENVEFINTYFHFNLISKDPDDNKFVDCAVAGRANYLISHDKHYRVLKDIEFPKVEVLDLIMLEKMLLHQ